MFYLHSLLLISLLKPASATHNIGYQSVTAADDFFLETLRQISEEAPFETLFLLQRADQNCVSLSKLQKQLQIPLVLRSSSISVDKLKDRFNSKLLTVVCLREQLDLLLLNVMAANLQHARQTRIILHIAVAKPSLRLLSPLQSFLEEHKMTKVIGIFDDFYTDYHFYRYNPFPSGHWTLEFLHTNQQYFLSHTDLQGKTFLTSPGATEPRIMIYEDDAGEQQISGYVGYLMMAFAQKYNFTWEFIQLVTPGANVILATQMKYLMEGALDFVINLSTPYFDLQLHYPLLSYPLEFSAWFIVVPCPQMLDYSEIYSVIMSSQVICILVILALLFSVLDNFMRHTLCKRSVDFNLVNILVNDTVVRGILGLPFIPSRRTIVSMKLLYLCMFVLGLFVSNMYSAYFQTLFTSPPLRQEIHTFDDVRRANLKLMFIGNEFKAAEAGIGPELKKKFEGILQLEDTDTFKRHRSEYDTNYGYTMPESIWNIFELQQQTFERKLFCLAPNLKFFDTLLMSVPLAENSYLTALLNMFILRVIETGIFVKWHTMTFIDMWKTGKLSLQDKSSIEQAHVIRFVDMQQLWFLLLCGLGISGVVFIAELCVYKLKKSEKKKRKSVEERH